MGKKIEVTDPKGNKFESITSMCNFYGVSTRLYSDRISRGFTINQALGIEKKPREKFYSCEELCKKYNIDKETFEIGKELGMTISSMRKLKLDKIQRDHTGTMYKSFNKMCDAWGVNPSTVRNRLKNNKTLAEALEGTDSTQGIKEETKEETKEEI